MLRGGGALANVLLCLVCLPPVMPTPVPQRTCSRDSITQVDSLIQQAPDWWLDTKLYTPTKEDYQNCPRSTMNCFAAEVEVLLEEWTLRLKYRRLSGALKKLGGSRNQTESPCLRCERLQEENAETFLQGLRETLEYVNSINSKHC